MKVITVFKTHFDIGFTDLSSKVVERYSTKMLDDVLQTCEQTQSLGNKLQYVWTMSSWPLYQTLKNAAPDKKKRAEELIARGQLVWHALPFTVHTESAGPEELLHSFDCARMLCEKYHKPFPVSAKMTDVPGHTRYLVSILSKANVKFIHLGCNSACMPPKVPMLFWWEGPDRSRVLTFYSASGYGSDVLPPEDWPFPVWLNMNQTNDNVGPQGPEIIQNLLEKTKGKAELQIGTMDDFYREIIRCDLSNLPVIPYDLADSWIHGVGTYPKEVSILRRARHKMIAAEMMLSQLPQNEQIDQEIQKAYLQALLFDEHTWGMDVKTWLSHGRGYDRRTFDAQRGEERYKIIEKSWNEQRQRALDFASTADDVFLRCTEKLVDSEKQGLSVLNESGTEYTGYINVTDFAERIPDQSMIAECGNQKYIYVKNIAPNGIYSVDCAQTRKVEQYRDGNSYVVKNGIFELNVNALTGEYGYVVDKKMLMCGGKSEYRMHGTQEIIQFGEKYMTTRPLWAIYDLGRVDYPECESRCFVPEKVKVDFVKGGVCVHQYFSEESVCNFGMSRMITVWYTLLEDRLKIRVEMNEKPANAWVESLDFLFKPIGQHSVYFNKIGNTVDPKADIADNANHVYCCVEDEVRVDYSDCGLSLISYDAPLFSLGENGVFQFHEKADRKKIDGEIHCNFFNTMWGTNFPQWIEGDFSFEFDLVPTQKGKSTRKNVLKAYALPGIALFENHPVCVQGAELFSMHEENGKILVRLRESEGKDSTAKVYIDAKECVIVDLFGRQISTVTKNGDSFTVSLNKFEIVTLLFRQ